MTAKLVACVIDRYDRRSASPGLLVTMVVTLIMLFSYGTSGRGTTDPGRIRHRHRHGASLSAARGAPPAHPFSATLSAPWTPHQTSPNAWSTSSAP